jgi:prophage antirepressor-like protein
MVNPTLLLHPDLVDAQLAFYYSKDHKGFLFRGVDACRSLGYANASRTIRSLVDSNWVLDIDDGTARGNKVLYLIEAGFYQLCFSSNQPKAVKFRYWVFEDVLKSIREKGYYLDPNATSEQVAALVAQHEQDQKLITDLEETTQKQYEAYDNALSDRMIRDDNFNPSLRDRLNHFKGEAATYKSKYFVALRQIEKLKQASDRTK